MRVLHWVVGSALVSAVAAGACSGTGPRAKNTTIDGDGGSSGSAGTGVDASAGTGNTGTGGTGGTGATGGVGGGSGGTISTDSSVDRDACAAQSDEVKPVPAILQMVNDTSGSMNWNIMNEDPGVGEQTKWELTQPALLQAIMAMPDTLGLGMSFFPNVDGMGGQCINNQIAVPVDWLTAAQRALVETALTGRTPAGGTPSWDAWLFGYETVKASALEGSKFVLFITDGAPSNGKNCSQTPDNAGMIRDIAAALAVDNIGSFFVGVQGSQGGGTGMNMQPDGRPALSEMAEAGGTAPRDANGALLCSHTGPTYCHFDMTQTTDLTQALIDALNKITTSVISCTLDVPTAPDGQLVNTNSVEVIYTPGGASTDAGADASTIIIPRDPDAGACTNGWKFTDDTYTQVQLCGSSCDMVKADPKAKIVVTFDCIIDPGAPTP